MNMKKIIPGAVLVNMVTLTIIIMMGICSFACRVRLEGGATDRIGRFDAVIAYTFDRKF